ncbi:MAG: twin-arginine translocase subunit TatC [archaeon]|nr:twin-arginine translocase subunit TatC [archaeon]
MPGKRKARSAPKSLQVDFVGHKDMEREESLLSHLDELRKRLIVVVAFVLVFSVFGFFVSGRIIERIAGDLVPLTASVVVSHPLEIIYAQLKIGLIVGFVLALPLIIYEVLMFLKRGMTQREKMIVVCVVPFSMVLFLFGAVFSYGVVLKVGMWFLAGMGRSFGVLNLWSIGRFVSFVFGLCVALGFVFQLPIIAVLLSKLGMIDAESMKKRRKYVIVLMFLASATITPPDVVTQVLVAVPLIILYEFSIVIIRFFG